MSQDKHKAFSDFYNEHASIVRSYIRSLVNNDEEVNDISQKAFSVLYEKWETLNDSRLAYLYKTVRFLSYNSNTLLRNQKGTHVRLSPKLLVQLPTVVETQVEINDLMLEIANAMPEDLRPVFLLIAVNDFDDKNIGEICGNTIKQIEYKRRLIRDFVQRYYLDNDLNCEGYVIGGTRNDK
jgi:DNA-directed RNA polymerase specialized sigma24 family protein